ncbi:MAG: DivIVA domain-containing protein [Balneolales bacterium]|nr:DivIVA domain-containing protein [Balneolales bacterium]
MKLTPLEIKQQQFEKSLRGYDVADVQAFLSLVSNEYEHLLSKNKELEEQIEKLTDRVKHYERVEEALHETLQTTKESVAQKMDNARLEAKNLVDKAHIDAESIVKEANHQKAQIRQSILRLLDKREEIILGITSYLQNAQSTLEKFSTDELKVFSFEEDEPKTEVEEFIPDEDLSGSRFAFDDGETDDITKGAFEENDTAFPPGSDRLDDILDEID